MNDKTNGNGVIARMGIRMRPEVFDRLERALPGLKQEARRRGEKLTQQLVVEKAIMEYLDRLGY